MKKTALTTVVVSLLAITACKKDPPVVVDTTGDASISFSYMFGNTGLELNKQFIHARTGDTLTFSQFRHFVTNLKFKRTDGTWWAQPNSYYLVDAKTAAGTVINLADIPVGDYTAMEYTLGVDSQKNVSGANDGVLSLTTGMYWDWNSGYIMVKTEGESMQSPTGTFLLHLGGYMGADNIITTKTTDFNGRKLSVTAGKKVNIKMQADLATMWQTLPGVKTIDAIHGPGANAKVMARDFYGSFTCTAVE